MKHYKSHQEMVEDNIKKAYSFNEMSKAIEGDLLVKGKKANIGETREWKGKKVQKQASGEWKEVSVNKKEKDTSNSLIGFSFNHSRYGDVEVVDVGDTDSLYTRNSIKRPHNPMGYATTPKSVVVKDNRGEKHVLSFDYVNKRQQESNTIVKKKWADVKRITRLDSFDKLNTGDKVFFKLNPLGDDFYEGKILENLDGNSILIQFEKPIDFNSKSYPNEFEIDKNDKISENIYVSRK
jgi:hypothetical protein